MEFCFILSVGTLFYGPLGLGYDEGVPYFHPVDEEREHSCLKHQTVFMHLMFFFSVLKCTG